VFLRAATACIPVGYVAVTAGWVTTEVGRQPYVVYGVLRTADAVTPSLTGADVLASLVVYVVVYAVVFGAGLYYLVRLVQRGLPAEVEGHLPRLDERPARPLSAAADVAAEDKP
jgi:cytochrome d ubiquinol oxidase subunit I